MDPARLVALQFFESSPTSCDRFGSGQRVERNAKRGGVLGSNFDHATLFLLKRSLIGVIGRRFESRDVPVAFGGGVLPKHESRQAIRIEGHAESALAVGDRSIAVVKLAASAWSLAK